MLGGFRQAKMYKVSKDDTQCAQRFDAARTTGKQARQLRRFEQNLLWATRRRLSIDHQRRAKFIQNGLQNALCGREAKYKNVPRLDGRRKLPAVGKGALAVLFRFDSARPKALAGSQAFEVGLRGV